ncbi:MAG: DNA repair protein RadC [Halioglobus sp.]
MTLLNIQVYDQGELISSDMIEEDEAQPMTLNFENKGYEVRSEPAWKPTIPGKYHPAPEIGDAQQATIREAIGILETRLRKTKAFSSPSDVRQFCQLHIATEKDEHFCCMFLDSQHRLIAFERLFRGTIGGASVYPRVVVRRSLELNAAALILTHNHPSGLPEPSTADTKITTRLKEALSLIDVRVLDHVIVGTEGTRSLAESGLL